MRTPRRIIAGMEFVFFADLARHPDDYTSGTYSAIADAAPLRWWGIVIAALAAAAFLSKRMPPLYLMAGALIAWIGGLLSAVVSGDSQSPAGWTFQAGIVLLLLWGVGRPPLKKKG